MEAQIPPTKITRYGHAISEMGAEIGSKHVVLDLGPSTPHGKSSFTFLQLQELEHQALIYKHMAAGIPVPAHLVLPIWRSLGSTYAGTGIYPSFLKGRGVYLNDRNIMEPEPGRCRRTDGKKWRCAKDVVPDHKYCERHMHRGRNRSRKHVETPSSSQITIASTSSSANVSSTSSVSISVPLQFMNRPITTTNSNSNSINNVNDSSSMAVLTPKSVFHESRECKTESS
ncbi:hypothetical protein IFM89_019793 [Coptis chinensis]|uniref:Growth-regulating factor n=1 Tax=Coptis chinensis TaxID=261450 RepID=A0A835M0R3_9MAGN|nr:hypothetical protein IFM89_019793 [Coptis chinensis]